jgi:hypothetical protein
MARLGRSFLPEHPLHVIQRGNNRQAIFFDDDDDDDDDDDVRYRNRFAEAAAFNGILGCSVYGRTAPKPNAKTVPIYASRKALTGILYDHGPCTAYESGLVI